jgi:gluconokinase
VNPALVVVMGVSGCGKSTVGRALAERLGLRFIEGDEWHPPRNVALMAAGTPLTDDDRRDWLQALADLLAAAAASGRGLVLSCSALKRRYRDQLRADAPGLRFVHLHGAPELLAARMATRPGHYMPPSLLPSQLETLEPPAADEDPVTLDIAQPPEVLVAAALSQLEATA